MAKRVSALVIRGNKVLEGILGIQVDTSELISEYKKTLGQINNLLKRVSQAPKSQEEQNMYV